MEQDKVCACGAKCDHETTEVENTSVTTVEEGSTQEQNLFALLLALTPLAVFTLFGQIGLL